VIFRRPDAFIIKHIKFFHAIILLCLTYLLFRTSNLSTFYKHVADVKSIVGESNIESLFNTYMFVAVILGLIINVVIILLLIKKEKKFIFYITTTILLIATLVFYIMSYSNIVAMQKNDVSATVYLAYGDFAKIIFYILSVWVFIFLFKATGFDFKTFSIGKNVFGLDLTDADSEEVELSFEIDSNEINTKRKRKIREAKYFYFENRFKINLALSLLVIIIGLFVYKHIENNKEIYYGLNDELVSRDYTLKINDLYVTKQDYKGNIIKKDGVFVLVVFEIKKNSGSDTTFNTSNIYLSINEKQYYVNNKNADYLSDFGNVYKEQSLNSDYEKYILVYEIPYEFATNEVQVLVASNFDYKDNKYNYYKVKTDYKKISSKETIRNYYMNEEMIIDAYGIKTSLKVNSVEFQNKYEIETTKKINNKEYELKEYIVPTPDDNEEKTIMKINYESDANFLNIFTKYASIEYEINGETKIANIYAFISPMLVKENNVYYIQVSKAILDGYDKKIVIKVRDQVYKYNLDLD